MNEGGGQLQEKEQRLHERTMASRRPLVEKWDRCVREVRDPYYRGVMAVLFENLMARCDRGDQILGEDTMTTNAGVVTNMLFPLLSKVWANLIGRELISTQPTSGPVGTIFYIDLKYEKTKGSTVAGTNMKDNLDFNYASEYVPNEQIGAGDGVNYGGAGAALSVGLDYSPVRPLDATEGYSLVIEDVNPTTGVVAQTATDNGVGGFTGAVAAGAINYATGDVTGFLFTVAPANNNVIRATYYVDFEGQSNIPSAYADIASQELKARTRKLKVRWSVEGQDDLMAVHGVDANTLLSGAAAQEIILEIDRAIIDLCWRAAAAIERTFDFTVPPNESQVDHIRSFLTQMSMVSALIHSANRRGPANWAVMTPEIDAMLSQLETHGDYRPVVSDGRANQMGPYNGEVRPTSYNDNTGDFGVKRTGLISRKWLGYADPYAYAAQSSRHYVTMGLKGSSWVDAGAAYMPYIPLEITAPFLNPEDQTLVRGLRTRDRIALLRANYYGRVRVTGGI